MPIFKFDILIFCFIKKTDNVNTLYIRPPQSPPVLMKSWSTDLTDDALVKKQVIRMAARYTKFLNYLFILYTNPSSTVQNYMHLCSVGLKELFFSYCSMGRYCSSFSQAAILDWETWPSVRVRRYLI